MDDYEAIRKLTARYNHASDSGDREAWLNCFWDDGSFVRSSDTRSFSGRNELSEIPGRIAVRARHVTTDAVIEVHGQWASQTAYLMYLDRDDGFKIVMFGVYEDELRKVDDQWRFQSRRVNVETAEL